MSGQMREMSNPIRVRRGLVSRRHGRSRKKSVLTLFGTRSEVIKLAPVIQQLEEKQQSIPTINVASGQHPDLVYPLVEMFGIRVDFDLHLNLY